MKKLVKVFILLISMFVITACNTKTSSWLLSGFNNERIAIQMKENKTYSIKKEGLKLRIMKNDEEFMTAWITNYNEWLHWKDLLSKSDVIILKNDDRQMIWKNNKVYNIFAEITNTSYLHVQAKEIDSKTKDEINKVFSLIEIYWKNGEDDKQNSWNQKIKIED